MFRAIVVLPDGSSDGSPLGPVGSQTPKLLTVRADRSPGHGSQDMVHHCSPPPHPDLLQTPLVLHPSCMWETHLQGLSQALPKALSEASLQASQTESSQNRKTARNVRFANGSRQSLQNCCQNPRAPSGLANVQKIKEITVRFASATVRQMVRASKRLVFPMLPKSVPMVRQMVRRWPRWVPEAIFLDGSRDGSRRPNK